ncbi:pickpocket protein 11-like [Leptidea sinapis]|uniref:pickpocket protein 11-like n=1 Tax=Leptidea sinapis TaxID=189913 RepID=UPI0021C3C566|nr:pickpocket protein 11-like [Leptidea sinapis]
MRITYNGFCCVFNSQFSPEDSKNPVARQDSLGSDSGLFFVVKDNFHDHAYVRRPGRDVEVLLFDGNQYPMMEGPGIRSYPAQHNASVFFKLSVNKQTASPSLKRYSDARRGCHMPTSRDERQRNEVECLMRCRRRAVLALCSCVPHTLQPAVSDTICTPEHLPCLHKHREKFTLYFPGQQWTGSLSEEVSDSINCELCLFDCERLNYVTNINHVHYHFYESHKMFYNKFVNGLQTMGNVSVIRIFYSNEDPVMLVVEPRLRWFETIALMGSQWLFLSGVVVLGWVELLYHLTVRWWHHYRRRGPNAFANTRQNQHR